MDTYLYILRLKIDNLENRARNSTDDAEFNLLCKELLRFKKEFKAVAIEKTKERRQEAEKLFSERL